MIEMRQDPTTRAWILVGHSVRKETAAGCPFCPDNEAETPPTMAAITGPDGARLQREEEFYVNPVTPEEAARQLLEMAAG
jgi:galactose-1-phosphate uridylyltransferase